MPNLPARIAALVLFAGCNTAAVPTDPPGPPDPPVTSSIAELHERAIARTCALNGGVCHNSREYPDLHTVANLLDAIGQPCNIAAPQHADVHDDCEPLGDQLAISSLGVEGEIARVTVAVVDGAVASATVLLTSPVAGVGAGAIDAEVRRGTTVFPLGAVGAVASIADDGTVALDLSAASPSAAAFLDDRVYPWRESMVRVADVNGNGVAGHGNVRLIVPGQPQASYLILRLTDAGEGDLMPKQCRAWSTAATRALGCWIEQLTVDGSGRVAHAFDAIDLDHCRFDPGDGGRCATASGTGFAAVESLFSRSCGGSRCHVDEPSPAAGLDLTPGRAYAALVSVSSTEAPTELRVQPGSPDASYLLCKLDPSCTARAGARMPLGAPAIDAVELATLRDWVTSLAP